eukprot:750021-Hanusia_phi.AAC.1
MKLNLEPFCWVLSGPGDRAGNGLPQVSCPLAKSFELSRFAKFQSLAVGHAGGLKGLGTQLWKEAPRPLVDDKARRQETTIYETGDRTGDRRQETGDEETRRVQDVSNGIEQKRDLQGKRVENQVRQSYSLQNIVFRARSILRRCTERALHNTDYPGD